MNWFGKKGDRLKGIGGRDTATQPLSPITSQLSPKSPLRAGIFAISLALFTGFLMIHTAAVVSSPQNFTSGPPYGQTDWTVGDSAATSTLPINPATYVTYTLKAGGIVAGGTIQLQSDSYTATDDGTLTTTGSATGGGFNAGTKTQTAVSGTDALAKVTLTWIWECGDTIQDIDGNTYNTVLIGTQCWMKTNLNVTKNPAGSAITRYCYSNNTSICATDGGLYTWTVMMNGSAGCNGTGESQPACSTPVQGICPTGWHIPSHDEWTLLERSLLGSTAFPYDTATTGWLGTTEGTLLKSSGSPYFYGLLAGLWDTSGFYNRGAYATFWSSSVNGSAAWERYLGSVKATVSRGSAPQAYGVSVRCLKN